MKIIEVVVTPSGDTTVQTRGFVGPECQEASRWLERSLGITTADQKTAEFHQATPEVQTTASQ